MCPAPYRRLQQPESDGLYTGYNIWYEHPHRIYCVNYSRGRFIPAGSRATVVGRIQRTFKKNPLIRFSIAGVAGHFDLYFAAQYHPGLDLAAFGRRLFGRQPFTELTRGLTLGELECVRQGRLVPGISKRAVILTLGYPPEHRTPSLELPSWIYWTGRFATRQVQFDERGLTLPDS